MEISLSTPTNKNSARALLSHLAIYAGFLLSTFLLASCGGGSSNGGSEETPPPENVCDIDCQLSQLIAPLNLTGNPASGRSLPNINDPIPQLGKKLFFSKSLSGDLDTACASCHHPALGGGDQLSLSIGAGALEPNVLSVGRQQEDGLLIARNAPTTFNVGLYDSGLFWDSRIESVGKENNQNGAQSGILTPDSTSGNADPNAGPNLVAAQARFPVVTPLEMRGEAYPVDWSNEEIRNHIAARIGDFGSGEGAFPQNNWLAEFQVAFSSSESAENLITFDNITLAIGEYLRSQVFIETPWKSYLDGDLNALSLAQKRGALLFFNETVGSNGVAEGGACSSCHSGDFFTDELHHKVGFPQIGPGKDAPNNDDLGREAVTELNSERYRFRTPSLLNTEITGPWGHSGSYDSLEEVVAHYADVQTTVDTYFSQGGWCQLSQFENVSQCASLFSSAVSNTQAAIDLIEFDRDNFVSIEASGVIPRLNLTQNEIQDITEFLRALTDPCTKSATCLAPWLPEQNDHGPDGNQLNAVDQFGNPIGQ